MISEPDIAQIEATDTTGRWYVHDGFDGWSYGCPLDPTPIARACALRILSRMTEGRHPDAVSKLAAFPNALDYADENDELYATTGRNRLIAFLSPSKCVFRNSPKPEQEFHV
jgi:hypothetical protein